MASFLRTSLLSLFLAVAGVAHAQVAAAVGGDIKTVSICKPAAEQSAGRCSDGPLWAVNSQDGLVRIETSVRIDRQPREPLAVTNPSCDNFVNARWTVMTVVSNSSAS